MEAVKSVQEQSYWPDELLFIDDSLDDGGLFRWYDEERKHTPVHLNYWRAPWRLGVAHAFNFGVALARFEHVIMLGSDDTLEPQCVEWCSRQLVDGLYYSYFPVQYMDNGELQDIACNAAMVTKTLWQHTGGFPVQSASGAPDCALLSIMMANPEAGRIVRVGDGTPLYNYRRHGETDTAKNYGNWERIIIATRDLVTREWRPR